LHTYIEAVLLKALCLRGHDVEYYLCDGASKACFAHKLSRTLDKLPRTCRRCRAMGQKRCREVGVATKSMRSVVADSDWERATAWVKTLTPAEYPTARHADLPIGEWVKSSVISRYRLITYRPADPDVDECFRRYLESGLSWALALDRLMAERQYDRVLLFNGRFAFSRILLELAKRRDIPAYIHERGSKRGDVSVAKDGISITLERLRNLWSQWKDVPLLREQIEEIAHYQYQREGGNEGAINWRAFTVKDNASGSSLRQRLGIASDKIILALFPSSTDELAADPELSEHPPSRQHAWIREIIDIAVQYPLLHLVVRVHPNMQGNKDGLPEAKEDLKWFKKLKEESIPGLSVVAADEDVSTYDLMDHSAAGISYMSTCSLEMALRGKPSCYGERSYYEAFDGIEKAHSREGMEVFIARCAAMESGHGDPELQKNAFRFLWFYRNQFGFPFPLVATPDYRTYGLAYRSDDALLPGKDKFLDFLCAMIADGSPVDRLPGEAERSRTNAEEKTMFSEILDYTALGKNVSIRKREYALPGDATIRFSRRDGNSHLYILSGWGSQSHSHRPIDGSKARLAFMHDPDDLPHTMRVSSIIPRDAKLSICLNGREIGAFSGSGFPKEVATVFEESDFSNLNILELALVDRRGDAWLGSPMAVRRIIFLSLRNPISENGLRKAIGNFLGNWAMYISLWNRNRKNRK
jgi:hypothetical protein